MATRRVIKSVLGNFLGTYTSRYSDFGGYWLFGFLVADLTELQINLLGQEVSEPASPRGVAISSAIAKFEEQREKSHLARSHIHEAWLTIQRLPGTDFGWHNKLWAAGFKVCFSASARTDDGKRYDRNCTVFVTSHDPLVEHKSET